MPRDKELKKARGYVEDKSIVWADGREKLVGQDWKRRRVELWERAKGRCEIIIDMLSGRCRSEAHDPHHVKARSKGRDDRLDNLLALCRLHHDLMDKRKPRWSKRIGGRAA